MINTYTLECWAALFLYLMGCAMHAVGQFLFAVGQAEVRFALVILYIVSGIWDTLRGFCAEDEFEEVA